MYKFNGFTTKAAGAINLAITTAEQLGHTYVGSEHILLGILRQEGCVARAILEGRQVYSQTVMRSVINTSGRGAPSRLSPEDLTGNGRRIIETAAAEAKNAGFTLAGTEQLLSGILGVQDCSAVRELLAAGCDCASLRRVINETICADMRENEKAARAQTRGRTRQEHLDKYGIDITEKARKGELDPVIGRDREIDRMIQILARRTKNNPCLIGETGVGKTAVVEGLAQRIVMAAVPDSLLDTRIISLDLTSMVAGTKYRGDFEERIRLMLEEAESDPKVILFIDEMHIIVGIGSAEGAVDAANILKPHLARGRLTVIGATTTAEYRRNIEKDPALERRFQSVMIEEPGEQDAVKIIMGLRDRYEAHHRVNITDEAVTAAVKLSGRYIPGRFLPDKAIDLIDEAASYVRMTHGRGGLLLPEVGRGDIEEVISRTTGIAVSRISQEESARCIGLEDTLRRMVVGQDEAVRLTAAAIRRSWVGLKNPRRPIGSFIFLGPTGVGKTQLCRALGEALFGSGDAIIKLDMSEYMEKHSVSKLIGAPPGYMGCEEGGQLTDKVRSKPFSVVVLDEMEKAHPEVCNLLLQVLEDGVLTDSRGRKALFNNTVVIMTSNVGAELITSRSSLGFGDRRYSDVSCRTEVLERLKKTFPPEFLNRVDDIVVFERLGEAQLIQIAAILLEEVKGRLAELGYAAEFTPALAALVAGCGSDRDYGARPLRRAVQTLVEDPIAEGILSGRWRPGDRILCDSDGTSAVIAAAAPLAFQQ